MKRLSIILRNDFSLSIYLLKAGALWITTYFLVTYDAQAQASKQFKVKAGQIASAVIPFQDRYRYPEFVQGKIMYTNGTSPTMKLNYNIVLGEMQFIDPQGDTLTVVNEYTLERVQIGQALYYNNYKQGYYEVIASYPALKLASQQVMQQIRSEDVLNNGYGTSPGQSTAARSVRYFDTSQKILKDIVLTRKVFYFIIDQNERIYPANRANLMKIGKKHNKALARYLKNESINLKKEEDLKKVLTFFSQLG